MRVRAKFRCEKNDETNGEHTIQLWPVTSGSPENEEFFKYTPGGEIRLNVVNEVAAQQFVVGKEYYVDFVAAE